ncbi:MAG: hypothetical protein GF329_19925 [Candidatus Lokiarchaeota archaeon]|nr:hypothetical protein [Candidatus Lokiarchaeota archaeon]
MNIEDIRFLLSVLIQTLPTVLSLGLIALFAFPKSRKGNVRNLKIYYLFVFLFLILAVLVTGATIQDVIALSRLEEIFQNDPAFLENCILLSSIALFLIPIFLIMYLLTISRFESEGRKLIRVT